MAEQRCVFLAGAPDGDALCWEESALLPGFEATFARFMKAHGHSSRASIPSSSSSSHSRPHARWRSLAWHGIGCDQRSLAPNPGHMTFPRKTTATPPAAEYDFLEHSIAVLEHLDSSQILSPEIDDNPDQDLSTLISFVTTSFNDASSLECSADALDATSSIREQQVTTTNVKITAAITDLKRIPNADHIARIQPQTMTVSLVVGVITLSPTRTVHLRRRRAEMDIVELIVGDETRAGFSITFWLAPADKQVKDSHDHLRHILRSLHPGRVVLLQNVALSCFRGNVYGQSLSQRFTRNSTTITLLGEDVSALMSSPVLSKLQRVWDWTVEFVGLVERDVFRADLEASIDPEGKDELPPDTPD